LKAFNQIVEKNVYYLKKNLFDFIIWV